MISSKEKGNIGEETAVNYLIGNGYRILDRNYRSRYGEIDIIGEDNGYIAFVEVKSRKNFDMGLPCEAVNYRKQRQIARMALMYIASKKLSDRSFRFDVVEVVADSYEVKYIRLIKDAFQAC